MNQINKPFGTVEAQESAVKKDTSTASMAIANGLPDEQGLYDPAQEKDACGVGFVAHIKNKPSHKIIQQGLEILVRLGHRGAVGADPLAGDGAGVLIQLPHGLFKDESAKLGFELPEPGDYGVGMIFLPREAKERAKCELAIATCVEAEGQEILGWRDVPVDNNWLGETVKPMEPKIRQIFIKRGEGTPDNKAFERKLYVIRKQAHHAIWDQFGRNFYMPSFSSSTIVYKGMVLADNLEKFYLDLSDERTQSALCCAHQRFSTNTFPSWELAHPFRYLCHNGEINTVRGNINWMMARRHTMKSDELGEDLDKLWPLIGDGASDSATFDNALELLVASGYSLAHAMMLMIPEAWKDNPLMDEERKAFYEYSAAMMEPWDGPAAVVFTDGKQIGATLDRNGLRPARYVVTEDDHVIMASEVGCLDDHFKESEIHTKWRLQPGKMFLIDLEEGRIIDDAELKSELSGARDYRQMLDDSQIYVDDLPFEVGPMTPNEDVLRDRQQAFGYSQEDLKFFLEPMAIKPDEPLGSMGRDTPIAVLSDKPKMLFDYFHQNFAQVTNPPIDPIREALVMSLVSFIGPRPNLLDMDDAYQRKRLTVDQPILTNLELEKIRRIENHVDTSFRAYTLDICYAAEEGAEGMEAALQALFAKAEQVCHDGYNILILSDRGIDAEHIAIPSLLATAGVHHHLIRAGLRTEVGLVVETGEARQAHDFCTLAGYGAEAINPYLAFDTLSALDINGMSDEEKHRNYIKAVNKGFNKVMSKMGISTYQSYCGAQIFDAVGLSEDFVAQYFTKTATAVSGVGLEQIAGETTDRHQAAFGEDPVLANHLDVGGELAYRIRGEEHVWTPETIGLLQHACRSGDRAKFDAFTKKVDAQDKKLKSLRGLFDIKVDEDRSVPLDEVEPASEIVKRFATGAMSFGSISWEAHTTLAIAMNRLGGKSNTGEGGEEAVRWEPMENGDSMRSAIKQVASGRFGVTTEYLANADDIQIKMAQGAKPGEGGQLPGHKVDDWIGRVRHSTPGVGLISPPPHHDIYSIEDLAQLIHDLKNVNPAARVSVKLVSEVGVGTVAAGVSKAHADHVTISGFEGGTGASPITSIMHAGSPWEIGLAETHQTLVLNDLRGRIAVQVDGGLRTGRDVIIGALLGADEFGFATAALISEGCILMRKCHLNTCPVGVATQDPELRKRFTGHPDHVVNYFTFIAEQVRELMAALGFRTFNEMIGRADLLNTKDAIDHWKARGLDFTRLLHKIDAPETVSVYNTDSQDHGLELALDNQLIEDAKPSIESGVKLEKTYPIRNVNRSVGAMLSGHIAKQKGHAGLAEDTLKLTFEGNAGQSFGAFLSRGLSFECLGDANDYVGKGISGGKIVVRPHPDSPITAPQDNIIIGNTCLYGAIEGECYFNGVAGERFAVRNSGAVTVVEGVGDHGCEYMTGGCVVVIGGTGRNFAAGMSGGIAYVLDEDGSFDIRCNMEMVELGPVSAEEGPAVTDILADPLRNDAARLKTLVQRHADLTGSPKAKALLADWDATLSKFIKVTPVDYRNALEAREATQQAAE
ncbi:MAG: glutamate synthase large subunit [Magnetovibrionaceae bacterium]